MSKQRDSTRTPYHARNTHTHTHMTCKKARNSHVKEHQYHRNSMPQSITAHTHNCTYVRSPYGLITAKSKVSNGSRGWGRGMLRTLATCVRRWATCANAEHTTAGGEHLYSPLSGKGSPRILDTPVRLKDILPCGVMCSLLELFCVVPRCVEASARQWIGNLTKASITRRNRL